MNLGEMTKRVASYINYDDSSGDLLTGKDISETNIHNWINDRYLEEIFPEFSKLRPEFYAEEATTPNYSATGVVDASSTGKTLVATTAIFTNGMIDGFVFNSTKSEKAVITGYTSTTVVTLETEIGDDWDGDTIYIFDGRFTFSGDASDLNRLMYLGVKYESGNDYRKAEYIDDRDLFSNQRGPEIKHRQYSLAPLYTFDTFDISGDPTSGIIVYPYDWDEVLEEGIFLRYVAIPSALSADADEPRLPQGHHKLLVYGATADAFDKLQMYDAANKFETRYQIALDRLRSHFPAEREKRRIRFNNRSFESYLRRK